MRRRILTVWIAFAFCMTVPLSVANAQGVQAFDLFERFAKNLPMTRLAFAQKTYNAEKVEVDHSQGVLFFQSAHYFRLQYDREDIPLLVADGDSLWVYEADIKQAVVRSLEEIEQVGLLDILSEGKIQNLESRYIFSSSLVQETTQVIAHTRSETESIRSIAFVFSTAAGELQKIRVSDAFQGVVEMDILSIAHEDLSPELFQFIPSDDTDVLRDFGQ